MFQTLGEDLPILPTEIRKLRSELMNAEGIHLIYNVPRSADGIKRAGPVAPFAGLCVAVLIYLPNDLTGGGFNVSIGEKGRIYAIGWNVDSKWGLHSVTYTDDTKGYLGRKDDTVKTFKKGYSYLYFYFKNSDTLNGFLNKDDLKDDNVHPYPVYEAGKSITCTLLETGVLKCLEIHWVAWGSSHNQSGGPSSTLVDQLFPKTNSGIVRSHTLLALPRALWRPRYMRPHPSGHRLRHV